jgi:hypothetical protein
MLLRKSLLIFAALLLSNSFSQPLFASTHEFNRNLSLGSSGQDVLELQKFLNTFTDTRVALSGPGSPGQETTYFGGLTKTAVIKYQEKYRTEVLTPAGLTSGSGFVGPLTRTHINKRLSLGQQTTALPAPMSIPTGPKIERMTPLRGPAGTEVTFHGSGFTKNNIIHASFAKIDNVPSEDGKTLKFIVKEPFPDDLFVPDFIRQDFKTIQYGFYVENEYGRSSNMMFTLDLIK